MTANVGLLLDSPLKILGLVFGLLGLKFALLYAISRATEHSKASSRGLSFALPQAGEFGFVLFALAVSYGVMDRQLAETLVIVVTLSMIASPLLMMLQTAIEQRIPKAPSPAFDRIDSHEGKVIIAGFGRFGQIVGRVLRMRKIQFTALEASVAQVELLRRFGNKVFYGDASRLELLHAAGAAEATVLVVAIDDIEASVRTVELARRHYPHLKIFARARNRQHAIRLMDFDVRYIIRETLLSSLDMSQQTLEALGFSRAAALESVRRFRQHDDSTLQTQRELRDDEQKLIQSSQLAAKELERLFDADESSEAAAKEELAEMEGR
jgi:glutathione-regulated potassium-efflux system ancillary protein KefC/glutathione-regulated potassium-efflux system protein KefB